MRYAHSQMWHLTDSFPSVEQWCQGRKQQWELCCVSYWWSHLYLWLGLLHIQRILRNKSFLWDFFALIDIIYSSFPTSFQASSLIWLLVLGISNLPKTFWYCQLLFDKSLDVRCWKVFNTLAEKGEKYEQPILCGKKRICKGNILIHGKKDLAQILWQ